MIEQLLPRLEPGMLLLADRGIFSYALWRKAIGDRRGPAVADPHRPRPAPAEHLEDLPDGSWLAELRRSTGGSRTAPSRRCRSG